MTRPVLAAYEVMTDRWPLVTARATAAVRDDQALAVTYRALEDVLARKQPFVALLDLRGGISNSGRRRRLAGWSKQHDGAIRTYMVALGVVVGSAVERGFVTAVLWIVDNPHHMRVFSDYAEAERWLLSQYARREGS